MVVVVAVLALLSTATNRRVGAASLGVPHSNVLLHPRRSAGSRYHHGCDRHDQFQHGQTSLDHQQYATLFTIV